MFEYYGVKCKTTGCGAIIYVDSAEGYDKSQLVAVTPGLEPMECPSCHKRYGYSSDDIVRCALLEPSQTLPR